MPSSFVDSVPPIIHTLIGLSPSRVLDVGPGWGKYGIMCLEYLPQVELLDALEVPEGRLRTQDAIYDHVIEADARTFSAWGVYDVVLLVDVIEHMGKEDGHALLDSIQGAGTRVLVSTPKEFFEQHDDHNPYEEHVSHWAWEDFAEHGVKLDASTISSIIYVLKATRKR